MYPWCEAHGMCQQKHHTSKAQVQQNRTRSFANMTRFYQSAVGKNLCKKRRNFNQTVSEIN